MKKLLLFPLFLFLAAASLIRADATSNGTTTLQAQTENITGPSSDVARDPRHQPPHPLSSKPAPFFTKAKVIGLCVAGSMLASGLIIFFWPEKGPASHSNPASYPFAPLPALPDSVDPI